MAQARGKKTIWLVSLGAIVAAAFLVFFLTSPSTEDLSEARRARRGGTQIPPTPDSAPPERAQPEKTQPSEPPLPANWPQPSNIKEDFHIGLVTGAENQGEDEAVAVRRLENLYGQADQGGRLRHVTLPDNFIGDLETTISRVEELAADPLMRVIVVNEAVPGVAEAFRKIRAKRPEIFLLAAESHEDLKLISETSDVVVGNNFLVRGYLIPHTAKKLGAKTLAHISFPRHMVNESLARQRAIMEEACRELGLTFVFENSPDPLGEAGVKGAQDFILESVPKWLERYGPETAFFSTDNSHAAPLIRQVIKLGGYFVESATPSPLAGYPEALALDKKLLGDDWAADLERIEKSLVNFQAAGRLGGWASSSSYGHSTALVEFGRELVLGQAKKGDFGVLLKCYEKFSPGVRWRGEIYLEPEGQALPNVFLVYQDTYVFGSGFVGNFDLDIPAKYKSGDSDRFFRSSAVYHIGVVTGTEDQGGEDLMGALEMERRYGRVEEGGLIKRLTYGDDLLEDPKKAADLIASLAEDPLMKVIVVNQALDGTAEAFQRVKAKRPDIFCLASEPFEEAELITAAADLAIATDYVSRGYLIPYSAKLLGAKTFAHLSFPRHMEMETLKIRSLVMRQACQDLGLEYVEVEVIDPIGPQGTEVAKSFIPQVVGELLAKYGPETSFFCTNDALTEPLIQEVAKKGGIFVEADIPSPLMGYPTAFDLRVEPIVGQWTQVLKAVEDAVVEAGGSGRLGAWAYPLGFSETAGLVEFGKLLAEGRANIHDTQAFLEVLDNLSPGARWNGSYYNDPKSGKPLRNYFLVFQDTYVFGRGYIETTKMEVPEKYFSINR
ncbi:MAG: DUF3798 domain-containing protein [Deltaproteobacteria bacterium]|jgi:DNA-binding LacI/PurR family transcriptional regulator|nr:DUF3798 domain-containing protein [Deltaproteobacteria bacterium]